MYYTPTPESGNPCEEEYRELSFPPARKSRFANVEAFARHHGIDKPEYKKAHRNDSFDKTLPVIVPDGYALPLHDADYSDDNSPVLVWCPSVEFAEKLVAYVNNDHANREQRVRMNALTWMFVNSSRLKWDPQFSTTLAGNVRKGTLKSSSSDAICRGAFKEMFDRVCDIEHRKHMAEKSAQVCDSPKRGSYWFDGKTIGRGTRVVPKGVTPIQKRFKKAVFSGKKGCPNTAGCGVVGFDDSPSIDCWFDTSDPSNDFRASDPFFETIQGCYVSLRASNVEFHHDLMVEYLNSRGLNDHCEHIVESISLVRPAFSVELTVPFAGEYCVESKRLELVSKLETRLQRPATDDELHGITFDAAATYASGRSNISKLTDLFDDKTPLSHAYMKHGRVVHQLSGLKSDFRCMLDIDNGRGELAPIVECDISASYFQSLAVQSHDEKAMRILSNGNDFDLREMIQKRAEDEYDLKRREDSWKADLMVGAMFNHDSKGFYASPIFKALRDLFPKMAAFIRKIRGNKPFGPSILSRHLTLFEGSVVRDAIVTCKERGIPVISNNDGIFCAADRVEELQTIFGDSFEKFAGYRIKIGIKTPPTTFLKWLLEEKRDVLAEGSAELFERRIKEYEMIEESV